MSLNSSPGKLAVTIAGAGSRGIRAFGMIKAFVAAGLEYDFLSGTSSGSLNGCLWHQDDLEQLEELWLTTTNKDVFTVSVQSVVNGLTDMGSFKDSTPLKHLIEKYVSPIKAKSNTKPFLIHTTNMTDESSLALLCSDLADDELSDFLLASSSIPLAFPPVTFRGSMLVDGGVMDNYGLVSAVKSGADTVICMIPASKEFVTVHNAKGMLDKTIHMMMDQQLNLELEAIELRNSIDGYRKVKVIMIRPQLSKDIGFLDFDSDRDTKLAMIDQGYKLAQEALRQLG